MQSYCDRPPQTLDRSHAPYLIDKTGEQGRGIVPSPRQCKRHGHVQVDHGQDGNGSRTPPACTSEYPSDAQAGGYKTEDCCLVKSFLDDSGRLQTSEIAFMHQSVVESRACPPWEPDKRRIGQVAQAEFLESCERMSFGQGQLDLLPADGKLVQIRIGLWHEIDEPCIQSAGSYRSQLLQTSAAG